MLHSQVGGQGPDLVLLHGWGMNAAVWEDTGAALASNFRVTLIDLPGHGHSPWDGRELRLTDWAQACLEVAPPTALWVGWSLGGSVALEAAIQAPQRIRGLMLVTATPRFVRNDQWPHALPETTLTNFRHALGVNWSNTLERFLTLQVKGSDSAFGVLRTLRRRLAKRPSPHPLALDTGLDLLRTTDLCARLPELQPPSLWLYGERDTLVPRRSAESLARLVPDAQIETIKGAAHAPFLSHRDQAFDLLRRFIEERS